MPTRRKKGPKAQAKGRAGGPPFVATISVELADGPDGAARARALAKALGPEGGRQLPGSRVTIREVGTAGTVELKIEAHNLRALRAAVNSHLRWASLAVEVAKAATKRGGHE